MRTCASSASTTKPSHSCNPVRAYLNSPHSCSLDHVTCRQAQVCSSSCPTAHSRSDSCACPCRPSCCCAREASRIFDRANAVNANQACLRRFHRSPFNHTCSANRFAQSILTPRIFSHATTGNPITWTVADVGKWLVSINMSNHCAAFATNEIDGECLLDMDDASLLAIGVSLPVQRKKLLRKIQELFAPQGSFLHTQLDHDLTA
jgi:hypothetical protein